MYYIYLTMLKSIFDLPTSKDQLQAVNQGFANYKWLQKAPLRNISDPDDGTTRFDKGQITYRWDIPSSTYFIPSKCFLRMRCELAKADGTALTQEDGIGPSMGLMANLMNEMNLTINDQQVSVCDRHIGEIESIYTRLNKSGQWMRDVGQSVNFWESNINKRIQEVSSDGQLSEFYGGSDDVEIKNKTQLGFTATSTIALAATNILTFAVQAPDCRDVFKPGDIIVIKVDANVFQVALYIVQPLTALTVQCASFGTASNVIGATAAAQWYRWRYSEAEIVSLDDNRAVTQPIMAANNVLTTVVSPLRNLKRGDISIMAQNATQTWQGQPFSNNLTQLTAKMGSFNVQNNIVANAANLWSAIRWSRNDVLDLANVGYIQNLQNNGHAVDIAPNAAGDAILTITSLGTAGAVPDVNEYFKIGDIVVVQLQANIEYFSGLVSAVDPSGNNRSLSVIGESVLAGARGGNADGRNFMRLRIRHGGPSKTFNSNNKARQLKQFEIDWTPRCLSFFRLPHAMVGGAKYQLNMTPKNQYQINAVETLVNKTAGTDYRFRVLNMYLYIPTLEGKPTIDKIQYYLDLNEIRCQKIQITTQETSYTLDVRPSTNALAVAVQSPSVENNTNWSTSKFVAEEDFELSLNRFHIRYGAEQKPIPSFDMDYSEAENKDYWNEIYMRNLLASNAYFDSSGESIQEYYERGAYIYQIWPRSGDDRETRVYVTAKFKDDPNALPNSNPQLLLFNFYKKYAIIRMDNGRVQEILVNEA